MPGTEGAELRREVGLTGATLLGLGSILGTGAFVSVGIGVELVGSWTVLALVLAGLVALCNALSSAQLAAAHPRSGGTYEYGYELIHPWAGFTAGWMFLAAKSASAAAAALGFASYLVTDARFRFMHSVVAATAVIVLTLLVAGGLRRSQRVNALMVLLTVAALLTFAATAMVIGPGPDSEESAPGGLRFLEAVALMFVAYTGYGRVATLGEEVRDPKRTIPKAIVTTLAVSVLLYVLVALAGVLCFGQDEIAGSTREGGAPLAMLLRRDGQTGVSLFVTLGAITAMLGVLLNLLLGLSRVLLAMGRRGDMPASVAMIDPKGATPRRAVLVMGAIVLMITLTGELRAAWSFSAFTVLVYYAITNWAALRLPAEERLYSRAWAMGGLASCTFLAAWVEPWAWAIGTALIVVGWAWRALFRRLVRNRGAEPPR
ncbi:MAG: APC family permease [Planctomycetota bacterium]